jgi:general secretion pathway protein C
MFRFNEWWPLIRRSDTKLVTWALGALIAAELARIVIMITSAAHAEAVHVPAVATRAIHLDSQGVNVKQIVAAHLFGVMAPEPSNQDPATAPRSTANLTLAGTIATENPQRGKAIIADAGHPKVYSVGQGVGGASLRWVYLDRVVLDRNGSLETLELPRSRLPGASSMREPARNQGSGLASAKGSSAPQQEPNVLEKIVDAEVSNNGLGQFIGIRVDMGDDRGAFVHSGLRNGDIVIAVNGAKLPDADRGQEMWKQVSTGSTVTVMRAGKQEDITLNFAP